MEELYHPGSYTNGIPNSVIRCGDRLTHLEFRVICNLLSWRDKSGSFWVYHSVIAKSLGTTDTRRIRRAISSMVRKGALAARPRTDHQAANTYELIDAYFETPDTATHTPGQDAPLLADTTPGHHAPYPPDRTPHTPRTGRPIPPDRTPHTPRTPRPTKKKP